MNGDVGGGHDPLGGEKVAALGARNLIPSFWELVDQIRAEETCACVQGEEGTFYFTTAKGGMQVWPAGRERLLPEEAEQPTSSDSEQPNEGHRQDNRERNDASD